MSSVTPPPVVPPVRSADDGPVRRVHFRLWQIAMTALTVILCGWFFTLGALPGITALFIAKHVLVAILVAGLHQPPVRGPGPGKS